MAEEMPPPIAPPAIIVIIMKPGKTSAMPVSASLPRCDTHHVSISPVEACAVMTRMFGHAIPSSVGTIAPYSSFRVRGLMANSDRWSDSWAAAVRGVAFIGSRSDLVTCFMQVSESEGYVNRNRIGGGKRASVPATP